MLHSIKKRVLSFVFLTSVIIFLPNIGFAEESQKDDGQKVTIESSKDDEQKVVDELESKFLKVLVEITKVGRDYAESANLAEKIALLECGLKYKEFFKKFSKGKVSDDTLKLLDACIKNTGHPRLSPEDAQLKEYNDFALEYVVSTGGFWGIGQTTEKSYIPNPLVIIKKVVSEVGQFTFEEGKRPDFVYWVNVGVRLILKSNEYGFVRYKEKMEEVMSNLKKLCDGNTIFQKGIDNGWTETNCTSNPAKCIPDTELVNLGEKINKLLSGKNTIPLTKEEKVEFGLLAADTMFSVYDCLLRLQKHKTTRLDKDCKQLDMRERINLGRSLDEKYRDFVGKGLKNKDDPEGDVSAKYSGIENLIEYYEGMLIRAKESQMNRKQNTVRNPLQEIF